MEVTKPSKSQNELLDIISSFLSSLNLKPKKRNDILLNLGKKINLIRVQDEENQEDKSQDFHHFYFFVKQLFLDENGNYDLNLNKLKEIIGEEAIKEILQSLSQNIQSGSFLDFLLYLGDLFSNLYFTKDKFVSKVKEFLQKGLNNYECLFRIFSLCKTGKETHYISGNYGIYFSVSYLNEIKYNLILATNIYIKLCLSDNYGNLSLLKNDEESKESSSDDSDNKAKRMEDFEKFLTNSVRTFWSNCIFIYSGDLVDFMNIFYDFITQNSFENHKFINPFDDSTKLFLEYLSYHLEKLFKYFDEESLNVFYMSLYDFVESHKGQNIKFVERALKIEAKNNLPKDKIGLISFICCNNKLMGDFENLAASGKIKSLEDLEKEAEDKGYTESEEYIVDYLIFNENAKQQDQNIEVNNPINNSINIDYNDDNNDKNVGANPDSDEMSIEEQYKIEIKKENNDAVPDIKKVYSLIEKQNQTIKKLNEKYEELKEKCEKYDEDIKKLRQNVDKLNDIHQTIYFRDVSKFYIREFSWKYNIKGDNTFEQCQNILKLKFSEIKDANIQGIIIKIVTHYLNGNKLSHMEFYIDKNKSLDKEDLIKEIEKSYISFMKFSDEEKTLLNSKFKMARAPFIYYRRFK